MPPALRGRPGGRFRGEVRGDLREHRVVRAAAEGTASPGNFSRARVSAVPIPVAVFTFPEAADFVCQNFRYQLTALMEARRGEKVIQSDCSPYTIVGSFSTSVFSEKLNVDVSGSQV